jgi:uncharacterized repeat protein (TIGR01451 family)
MRTRFTAGLAVLSLLGLTALWSASAEAQCVSVTTLGTANTENFDTLANTGTSGTTPTGWFFAESAANANALYSAGTGSGTAGDTYSFGPAASTDRAFGGLQSGSLVPTVGACFSNNSAAAINAMAIAYTGEQWRLGATGRVDRIDFQYSLDATSLTTGTWTDVNALDFTAPITVAPTGALDGNAVANRTALSNTITGLNVPVGTNVWIRWTDLNASGADDGLAVDDFSLTAASAFVLTTNSPQTVNTVVGGNVNVTVTADIANPTAGTAYSVGLNSNVAAPPLSNSSVVLYIGFPPGSSFDFARTCQPVTRGVFQVATDIVATQTSGVVAGANPQTATNVTWICQTPSDLTLVIDDGGASGIPGGTVTYAFNYANVSAQATAGVVMSTQVPANTTFNAAGSSAGWSCVDGAPAGSNCTFAVGALGASPAAGSTNFALNILPAAGGTTVTVDGSVADDGVGGADLVPADNLASDTTPVGGAADLTILLTDSPDPVIAGNNLSYTATLTNNGPSDAQDATIDLPLPPTTTFVSIVNNGAVCTTPAVGANGSISCTWAGLTGVGAGNARSIDVVALVPANTANGAILNAMVTASSLTADPTPINNTATAATAVIAVADLTSTLSDSPDPVTAGSDITYVSTLTNNGPSDAQTAVLDLALPPTATFVSVVPGGGVCVTPAVGATGSVTCTWAGATLSGGANGHSITVVANVPPATANGSVLVATAIASSATTEAAPGNNNSVASTTVSAEADLAITLTDSPDPVTAGTNLSYTATLTNAGLSDAQDASITLPLPAGTSFLSATPSAGGSCNLTSPVICTWAGATTTADVRSATIVVLVAPAQTAALSATATSGSSTTDPVPGNNSATADTAVIVSADLSITLSDAPDPVTAGTNLTYTATVSNAGPSDATAVTITLPLPAGTSLVSGTVTGGGSCAGAPVVCSVTGSIAPGTSRTATIILAVSPAVLTGTVISATATAGAGSPDPDPANNSASTTTTVITSADLVLSFSASALQALANEPVTFTASSLNQGPSDAQDVSITVTLTPDFRYSAHTPSAGAVCTTPQVGTTGAITCTWAGATAPGATRTLQVVAFSNSEGSTAVNASTTSITPDPVANNNLGNISVQIGFLVEGIPTLSAYGLILLGLMLGLFGFVAVRRES